jgi:hypothetical protein
MNSEEPARFRQNTSARHRLGNLCPRLPELRAVAMWPTCPQLRGCRRTKRHRWPGVFPIQSDRSSGENLTLDTLIGRTPLDPFRTSHRAYVRVKLPVYGVEIGPATGYLPQNLRFPWPACVRNAVCAGTGVPDNDSPIGQWHVATGTLLMYLGESQAKLKQFTSWLPRLRSLLQKRGGAAASGPVGTHPFISCGISLLTE